MMKSKANGAMLCAALCSSLLSPARADAPAIIPVQGFLSDADGVPIDGDHRVIFFLYDAATNGEILHTDAFNNLEVQAGQFIVYLGSQDGHELDLTLFRDHIDLWLEVVVDNETITPRTRLGAVPYAAACGDATTVSGQTIPEDIVNGNYVTADTGTVGDLTVTGTLNPGTLAVQEFHVDPTSDVAISSSNVMADFPDLAVTFTVAQTTPVMVSYMISMNPSSASHLVTRLEIDGISVGNTITGDTAYWSNGSTYVGTVAAGEHTVKVRYRTPVGATWTLSDWTSRRLDVLVLGR
jgi:hypothetical protein